MAELNIQPSINDARSGALLVLLERLGNLDLVPILVYRLDSVPDSAMTLLGGSSTCWIRNGSSRFKVASRLTQ